MGSRDRQFPCALCFSTYADPQKLDGVTATWKHAYRLDAIQNEGADLFEILQPREEGGIKWTDMPSSQSSL